MDAFKQLRMIAVGMDEAKATNIVWNHARDEQMKGKYTKHGTTFQCEQCVFDLIAEANGMNIATLVMMPLKIFGLPHSLIMGNKLLTMDDSGLPFVAISRAKTIHELSKQLHSEAISLEINSGE
jgi:hypothetical protein